MKKEVKCYRCGKVYDLSRKNIQETISCSHCHQQMHIDIKTDRRCRIMRYLLIGFISLVVVYGFSLLTSNSMLVVFMAFVFAILIGTYSERLCLLIVNLIFGLNYVEYHEIQKSKKELRKERLQKNKKKGFFNKRA